MANHADNAQVKSQAKGSTGKKRVQHQPAHLR